MAKPTKRKVSGTSGAKSSEGATVSSRVTPKGTRPEGSAYEPPSSRKIQPSPVWVPVLMFGLLAVGILCIVLNYVELLPGSPTNNWLLVGLGAILGGIITATQYR